MCYLKQSITCLYYVTLPIYALILLTLILSKEFRSAFFTLFISTSLADCFFILSRILGVKVREVLLATSLSDGVVATLGTMAVWFASRIQCLGVFLIAINRLTAIKLPAKHRKVGT